jgi:hypothetical protein
VALQLSAPPLQARIKCAFVDVCRTAVIRIGS